jgi:imidazolonepropionase-like amidohydrolase
MSVIKASTSVAAECIDAHDIGELAPGKKADLLIVDQDPTENLDVLREDKVVIKNGTVVK